MKTVRVCCFLSSLAVCLVLIAPTSHAATIYANDFQDAGEEDGFINSGGNFELTARGSGGDFDINGGGGTTVRTGANTSAFAAGSISGAGSLKFSVIERLRDRESYASLVDASGNHLLAIGNTNGTASLGNGEDPLAFTVVDNTDTVVASFANGTGGITLSGSSIYVALQVEIELPSGMGTLRAEDLAADGTASASGSYTDLGTFTLPAAGVAALANATGIAAGQSGGGTGFDEFVVAFHPIPEPASCLLGLLGAFSLIGMRSRV